MWQVYKKYGIQIYGLLGNLIHNIYLMHFMLKYLFYIDIMSSDINSSGQQRQVFYFPLILDSWCITNGSEYSKCSQYLPNESDNTEYVFQ